jgi:hypothetical protein
MNATTNLFEGHAELYRTIRPRYPRQMYHYLAELSPGRKLAWDTACGNGQAAVDFDFCLHVMRK